MAFAWLLLLAVQNVPGLIEQLADEDAGRRELATAELTRLGERARKELEEAARSAVKERAERADRILFTLNPLRLALDATQAAAASKDPIGATFRFRNTGKDPAFLLGKGFKVVVRLVELHETPSQEGFHEHGSVESVVSTGCCLSQSDFLKLAPDDEHRIFHVDVRKLWLFEVDPAIRKKYPDISVVAPTVKGRYVVAVTYDFNRAAYIDRCGKNCGEHAAPAAAWNRAPERSLRAEAEFTLR